MRTNMRALTTGITRNSSAAAFALILLAMLFSTPMEAAAQVSEIDVTVGGVAIVDNDFDSSDQVEQRFGFAVVGGVAVPKTFVIGNTGAAALNVSNITLTDSSPGGASHFSLSTTTLNVGASGSENLVITFDPSDAGGHVALVTITNDDDAADADDEESYQFIIEGDALMDLGDLPAAYNAVTVFAGGGDPARHPMVGPILGQERDAEFDGQTSATAGFDGTGDDALAGIDDEDGVTFYQPQPGATNAFAEYIAGSTVSLSVELSGGVTNAFLQAWLDYDNGGGTGADGDFADGSEQILSNQVLAAGDNLITFTVPTTATASAQAGMRFRVTSYESQAGSLVNSDGLVFDGEVEDYVVDIVTMTAAEVNMNTDGATLHYDGANVILTDQDGIVILQTPIGTLTSIEVTGGSGNSTLTVTGAMAIAGLPIIFNGGAGSNAMVIEAAGETVDVVAHTFGTATDGTIVVDCTSCAVPTTTNIDYFALAPIADNLSAVARTFDFMSGLNEVVTLSADGDGLAGNGISFIDSDVGGESVSFVNPTLSIAITSMGGGEETFNLGLLDTALPATFSLLTVDGDAGADLFNVTPSGDYNIVIAGAAPVGTCPGDALVVDLSTGAVVDTITNVAGTGSVSFTTAHTDINFTGIESIGDADLNVTANYSIIYSTESLTAAAGNELVITVTNAGPNDANCITVDIAAELDDWLDAHGTTLTALTSIDAAGSVWSIPSLVANASATLTVTGFAIHTAPDIVTFTSNATQDLNSANDVASVELSVGFIMPVKSQVNSALYHSKTVPTSGGNVTYDALIVGLFQGSPGIDGAVWCKIPDVAVGPAWMPTAALGDHWRPCADDLPFPLHVNDLYDDGTSLWLTTWGYDGLYRSTDGGESWRGMDPLGTGFTIVYTIVEDASGGALYISVNNGLVYRSFNDGVTWQQVASLPGVASDTPFSMVAHPSIAGTIYAGTHGNGVFVTEDFGFSWTVLDDPATVGTNENEALLNTDNIGDDFAGHIFDLEFSTDADYLYAGTGKGVWRLDLDTAGPTGTDMTGSWTQIGATVTLDGGVVVTPEIRTLAFREDGGDDDLVAGSWGFGAFMWDNPNASAVFAELTLREGHVTFVAAAPDGQIFIGTQEGTTTLISAADASATSTEPIGLDLPSGFTLGQNYPNPFNPVTTIGFSIKATGQVRLSVFDALGREVAVLVDGAMQAGQHQVQFSAGSLPTGTYLYRLSTPAGAIARTLVLMK
jgi:hypothetical protein